MEFSLWDVAAVAFKSLVYAGTLGAAGGVFFCRYAGSLISPASWDRIRTCIRILAMVALVATVMRVAIVAGSMGESITGLFDTDQLSMVLQAGEARASGVRMAGLLLIVTLLPTSKRGETPALIGAVLAATSFAWIGHAWAAKNGASAGLLALHLLCVAFWVGALVPLSCLARGGDRDELRRAVDRFAGMAVFVVAALVVAGALLLIMLLRGLTDLWTTEYGRWVMLKLALVAVLIGIAAFNRCVLTPRLHARQLLSAGHLRRSIVAEIALVAITLLVTATFTTIAGPE